MALIIIALELYLHHTYGSTGHWLLSILGTSLGLCVCSIPFVFGSRDATYGWSRGSNARPDPSRRLVIVADPHWSDELSGLHQATLAMPDADWLFLGDIFDVWVNVRGFETDIQRSFIWWLSERRRSGHWVGLWLGNREYFLDNMAHRFDFIGEGIGGKLHGEPLTFEHGDLINTDDYLYRFWNLLSRSGPVWLFANMIPPFIGKKLASVLEKALRTTNSGHKIEFPRSEFQRAANECGSPIFITGHFHTHEEVENGFSVQWANTGKFLLWHNGEFKPLDFNPNREYRRAPSEVNCTMQK